MGAETHTDNVNLPQFGPDDKPSWQGDINGAFQLIDAKFVEMQDQIETLTQTVLSIQQTGN